MMFAAKLLLAFAVGFAVAIATANGQHAQHHAVYEGWRTILGGSCCSDNDCSGADAWRYGPSAAVPYQVYFEGRWHDVGADQVRPYVSPDFNAHICRIGDTILCFIPGAGG